MICSFKPNILEKNARKKEWVLQKGEKDEFYIFFSIKVFLI